MKLHHMRNYYLHKYILFSMLKLRLITVLFFCMKNVIEKIKYFFSFPSYSRTLALLGVVILVVGVVITVGVLGQQTNTQQHAYTTLPDGGSGGGTPSCSSIGGSCAYGSCPNGTLNGDCGSMYVYCCKPTPTPQPSCSSIGGSCSYSSCSTGTLPGNCGSAYMQCCKVIPTPTPLPSCSSVNGSCGYSCPNGTLNGDCGSMYMQCCKPAPTPTPIPTCKSSSGESGQCFINNSCSTGTHQISGSCPSGYRVCCAKGDPQPWYDCKNGTNNNYGSGNNMFVEHLPNGSTKEINCGTNDYCRPDNGSIIFANSATDALPHMCHAFDPKSCTCSTSDSSHRGFSCNNGDIQRSCGNNMVCSTPGAQGGLWPCSASYSGDVCSDKNGNKGICMYHVTTSPYWATTSTFTNSCTINRQPVCYSPLPDCASALPGTHLNKTGGEKNSCAWQYELGYQCCIYDTGNTPGGEAGNPPSAPTQPACSGSGCGSGGTGGGNGGSCTNGQTTGFTLSLKLEGIGAGNLENNSPARPTRNGYYVTVTDESGTKLYNNTTTQFTYNNGTFNSPAINLGTTLSCGHTYQVNVKIPGYIKASATVDYGTNKTISLNPIQGDFVADSNKNIVTPNGEIIGDDQVTILDYNIMKQCRNVDPNTPIQFSNSSQTINVFCRNFINLFDYQDGGTQGDEWSYNYNLWARGFFKANNY